MQPTPIPTSRYRGLALAWSVVVWTLLLLPPRAFAGPEVPWLDGLLVPPDLVVHAGLFFPLGYLVRRGLVGPRVLLSTFGVLTLFAVSTELSQLLTPDRSAELADGLADLLGGAVGVLLGGRGMVSSSRFG